ncbi:MAG: BtpA/SgcQ family protein [Planctomycetota bacterium]|nr:BtpA/SgcQ family protein [Planctomycetota bacterium]
MSRRTISFWTRRPILIGVVHMPPLPGAPRAVPAVAGRRATWIQRAVEDAQALEDAGFDAVTIENYGDAPFFKDRVPPETTAALAVATHAVREALASRTAVGVNVLRNDALSALGIAAASSLDFMRVNVLTGAMATDQGVIEGNAAAVLRARARLAPDVRILADVRVKHAAPVAARPIAEEARDLAGRGGADALIVTGGRTGGGVDTDELQAVCDAVPDATVLVGSGATRDTVSELLGIADGVIVGTAIKRGGRTTNRVDPERAAAFVEAAHS